MSDQPEIQEGFDQAPTTEPETVPEEELMTEQEAIAAMKERPLSPQEWGKMVGYKPGQIVNAREVRSQYARYANQIVNMQQAAKLKIALKKAEKKLLDAESIGDDDKRGAAVKKALKDYAEMNKLILESRKTGDTDEPYRDMTDVEEALMKEKTKALQSAYDLFPQMTGKTVGEVAKQTPRRNGRPTGFNAGPGSRVASRMGVPAQQPQAQPDWTMERQLGIQVPGEIRPPAGGQLAPPTQAPPGAGQTQQASPMRGQNPQTGEIIEFNPATGQWEVVGRN